MMVCPCCRGRGWSPRFTIEVVVKRLQVALWRRVEIPIRCPGCHGRGLV